MRPFLGDVTVRDETLIDKVSEAASLEGERQKKLRKSTNGREACMCEIQAEVPSTASPAVKSPAPETAKVSHPQPKKAQAQDSATHLMLEQLKADVYEMRQVFLAAMETTTQHSHRPPTSQQQERGQRPGRDPGVAQHVSRHTEEITVTTVSDVESLAMSPAGVGGQGRWETRTGC